MFIDLARMPVSYSVAISMVLWSLLPGAYWVLLKILGLIGSLFQLLLAAMLAPMLTCDFTSRSTTNLDSWGIFAGLHGGKLDPRCSPS